MKKPGDGLGVDIGFSRLLIEEASTAWNALISYNCICCFKPVSVDVVSIFVIVSFVDLATLSSCSPFDGSIIVMMGSLKFFVINESEFASLLNSLLYYLAFNFKSSKL